jgi:hypothetical protein
MRRHFAWLLILAGFMTCSCRELLGVDEAAIDPALADASSGIGGEGGLGD